MIAVWQRLQARERRTLGLGGIVLLLILLWGLLWLPLQRGRDALRTRIAADAVELEWMREVSPRLAAQGQPVASAAQDDRSLLARVDAGAREAGLGASLLRVEPVGEGEVRMAFQSADFDALAAWLEQFAATGAITVTELSVQRVEGVGLVDARVALRETVR